MSQWVVFAILSAAFVGATSAIAKLGLSGLTTATSWVFDDKALKVGEV
jgi:uncharacterized membrane protein